jgi:hypothetical protein
MRPNPRCTLLFDVEAAVETGAAPHHASSLLARLCFLQRITAVAATSAIGV